MRRLGQFEVVQQEPEARWQIIVEQLNALTDRVDLISSREDGFRGILFEANEQLLRRNDEIQATLYDLQFILAEAQQQNALSGRAVSSTAEEDWQVVYQQLIRRIRDAVRRALPRNATVIVVSRGDHELLNLYGRQGWHFPQTADGMYAGYYPGSSTAAIAQLEVLRAKGADFLLFPQTAFWWLDYYEEFKKHLENRYRVIVREEDTCLIFAIHEPALLGNAWWSKFEESVAEFQSRFGRDPAILDWNTGLELASRFPQHTIFSPSPVDRALPYLDKSIDMVAISSAGSEISAEARRVAEAAVVTFNPKQIDAEFGHSLNVDWKPDGTAVALPTTSIVIPVYNNVACTEACLVALRETLPRDFRGEIIVVDDASTDDTSARLGCWAKLDERLKILRIRKNAGFISSCNRGSKAATGEILIFLNNYTLPQYGWLPPLLRTLRDYPDAGAVGGKLIYPDGSLREAGVLISSGSGANFGEWDKNPDAPLYNYVRKVDYCSAALLATPRSLFIELGGFDKNYCPAYYEDTDYCFKVLEKGYQVYYQPESTVIHLEVGSLGTDLSGGMKRYPAV